MSLPSKAVERGWTVEDIEFLLDKIESKGPLLVAGTALEIPTIHSIRGARHCGFGFFKAEVEGIEVHFDAGGAMQRTPSGQGWTPLNAKEYGAEVPQSIFNEAEVVATLESYL